MATQSNSTKQSVIESEVNDAGHLIIRFPSLGEEFVIDPASYSEEIRTAAMLHGFKQKHVDAAAIARNTDTGLAATPTDKFNAVVEVYNRLLGGMWNAPREGGGNQGGLLLRALIRMYAGKRTPEDVKTWLAAKSKDEQGALRKNPKIATIIAEIQAESVDPAIDTDAMLGELGE